MDKKKLAVIVPTANREDTIDSWLFNCVHDAQKYSVDLIVYDSSSDDNTRQVTQKYTDDGFDVVKYIRYDGIFDGFSLDHKVIAAYKDFADFYEYIWLIRDGLIPLIGSFYNKLNDYMSKKVQCIIVDALYRNYYQTIEKEYVRVEDAQRLLADQAHRLQTLGMLILSSRIALELIENVPLNDDVYSLWQMAAPLHYFVKKQFKIVYYVGYTFTYNRKIPKKHFWQSGHKMFEQWGYRWCNVIDKLPSQYDKVKDEVYKIYTVDFHPFTLKTVVSLRVYENMNYKTVKKYSKYLEKVTDTPIWLFYLLALTPKWYWGNRLKNTDGFLSRTMCWMYLSIVQKIPDEGNDIF